MPLRGHGSPDRDLATRRSSEAVIQRLDRLRNPRRATGVTNLDGRKSTPATPIPAASETQGPRQQNRQRPAATSVIGRAMNRGERPHWEVPGLPPADPDQDALPPGPPPRSAALWNHVWVCVERRARPGPCEVTVGGPPLTPTQWLDSKGPRLTGVRGTASPGGSGPSPHSFPDQPPCPDRCLPRARLRRTFNENLSCWRFPAPVRRTDTFWRRRSVARRIRPRHAPGSMPLLTTDPMVSLCTHVTFCDGRWPSDRRHRQNCREDHWHGCLRADCRIMSGIDPQPYGATEPPATRAGLVRNVRL